MLLVRAGEDALPGRKVLKKELLDIVWNRIGDLSELEDLESLKAPLFRVRFEEKRLGQEWINGLDRAIAKKAPENN